MNKLKNFPYKKALVLGLAKSGLSAATVLLENNIDVTVSDRDTKEDSEEVQWLKKKGAKVVLGSHPLSLLDDVDIVVKNPGIPYHIPILEEATSNGIPIITEIELASLMIGEQMIGITGSNGKTTTTTLIYDMFTEANKQVKLAGNIGTVASEVASHMTKDEQMIVELSSFQLLGIQSFKPKMAIFLNVYEAHLDYHHTMDHYVEAKMRMLENQDESDTVIYNLDNLLVKEHVEQVRSKKIPFSLKEKHIDGAWLAEDAVFYKEEEIIKKKDIRLVGDHNLENILASIACAKENGIDNESIYNVLSRFGGVEHRLQFVEEKNGRLFYNDSKATNILATKKALAAFKRPTILLAGGLDRGNDFYDLVPDLAFVKTLILFGETKEKLKLAGEKAGIETIICVDNMAEAVEKAYAASVENDVILLSPACASWDQYKTFEQRGNMYVEAIHALT